MHDWPGKRRWSALAVVKQNEWGCRTLLLRRNAKLVSHPYRPSGRRRCCAISAYTRCYLRVWIVRSVMGGVLVATCLAGRRGVLATETRNRRNHRRTGRQEGEACQDQCTAGRRRLLFRLRGQHESSVWLVSSELISPPACDPELVTSFFSFLDW